MDKRGVGQRLGRT